MFFEFGRSARIKDLINAIDFTPYVKKAQDILGLSAEDAGPAVQEYKHFLYLVYWNRRLAGDKMVVPTKRADKIWHAHIIYTRDYEQMCNTVFGNFLHHQPGLEEGTKPFEEAMRHTKALHDHVHKVRRRPGFDENYFSFVEVAPTTPQRQPAKRQTSSARRSNRRRDDSGSGDFPIIIAGGEDGYHPAGHHSDFAPGGGSFGGGGHTSGWGSGSSSDHGSSSSSSDSGSSGSSCSSCGGGCGG